MGVTTGIHIEKKMKLDMDTKHKNQIQVDYERKIIKLSEENIHEYLPDLAMKDGFLKHKNHRPKNKISKRKLREN